MLKLLEITRHQDIFYFKYSVNELQKNSIYLHSDIKFEYMIAKDIIHKNAHINRSKVHFEVDTLHIVK
ncbi:hypothetical protein T4D_4848 [Trichinella pseudospiralis]|uniref:Uncharacterized protein n=1 Tax=Trichinella pseudospiralis TaxID=6337 RepID=A0A0V1G4E2_TRIPS|nr:hypothetical protein T4D_4408 [Trichinella pseudospiralis]KRY92997.1 hypothetical protein T4D_4848 [Trichinella pseudospiralis]